MKRTLKGNGTAKNDPKIRKQKHPVRQRKGGTLRIFLVGEEWRRLDALVETGLWGFNASEAAIRILDLFFIEQERLEKERRNG